MIKYAVVDYYTISGQLHCNQVSKWFDSIKDAEAARLVILNENFAIKPQELRVVQYEFK